MNERPLTTPFRRKRAGELCRSGWRLLQPYLYGFIGCGCLVPLAFLIPKQRRLMVFIGGLEGRFADNVKYQYLHCCGDRAAAATCYYLTESRALFQELQARGLPALFYPSLASIGVLLRAQVVVVDNWSWVLRFKYHLLFRARKVQLTHGIALKKLHLDNAPEAARLQAHRWKWILRMQGNYPMHDLVVSPSDYTSERCFRKAYRFRSIVPLGYPRNDVLLGNPTGPALLGVDEYCLNRVKACKTNGCKVVVYAPTFRDTGGGAFQEGALDIDQLHRFCAESRLLFVFKCHFDPDVKYRVSNRDWLAEYDSAKDVYPLLPLADALITDYSSIYFDYLLLNRPVFFFCFDLAKYIAKDRALNFDYTAVAPGPKCVTQPQLQDEITKGLIHQQDEFVADREQVRDQMFARHDDQAASRIAAEIMTRFCQ